MRLRFGSRAAWALVLMAAAAAASAADVWVEVGASRSSQAIDSRIEAAVKHHARQAARLTEAERRARGIKSVFSLPTRVILTSNGLPLAPARPRSKAPGDDIIPTFDAAGTRVFPAAYRQLLEDVFTQAKTSLNALFGAPKNGGIVRVRNFDADIQDRLAIAGGYYVANGPDGPEIRLPVYNSGVSASIHYIHCLLLAYRGDASYFSESWNEGMARAVTLTYARTPNALPGNPTAGEIENALEAGYDIGEGYDWNNQPGLGANPFIAPNLLNLTLPPGGSTGGPFLLRYLMSGSAWAKVLTERPGFIAELNRRFYASPAAFTTEEQQITLGQQTLDAIVGAANATVEGLSLRNWVRRQFILDPQLTPGVKIISQTFSISPAAGTSDFGVFGFLSHAFRTEINGNETLLSGRVFPIFWRPDGLRFFTSAQDDIINLAGGFGSVAPNFPASSFGSQPYRVIVDLPLQNQTARSIVPAGSIATGANTTASTFFGTLTGFAAPAAGTQYIVRAEWPGGVSGDAVATNFAFGIRVLDAGFDRAQPLTVRVFLQTGTGLTEVAVRRVNKLAGPIGLDLRAAEAYASFTLNYPAGLRMLGLPMQAYRPAAAMSTGIPADQLLMAIFNPTLGRYDFHPDESRLMQGVGAFFRAPATGSTQFDGISMPRTVTTVALRPGWNQVAPPVLDPGTDRVAVTTGTESVSTLVQGAGSILGPTFFRWTPDPLNPDAGTYEPTTTWTAGQALFVRALRPEGASLIFFPPGAPTPQAPRLPSPPPANARTWQASMTLTRQDGFASSASIAQLDGASRSFEPKLDIELPPSAGGQQVVVDSGFYRDARSFNSAEEFRVQLQGLVPGQIYALRLAPSGPRRNYSVLESTGLFRRSSYGTLVFQFRAAQNTHYVNITTGGAR